MKTLKTVLVIMVVFHTSSLVYAQDTTPIDKVILLSGKVNCVHPINGTLSSVVVFNVNRGYGAVSDQEGLFKIKMGRTDTIMFSTAEHLDYYYLIEDENDFKNHNIEVIMVTDDIWLDAVTIMGYQSLEQFKMEILNMEIPEGSTSLALPVVNKYARQLSTGDGETDLVGPLTYLQNKFDRYYKMRKQVSKDLNENRK